MTTRYSFLAVAILVVSAGCATQAPKVAAVPAPPVPRPDPPALIFPQTALELPDPQPVPPAAIPKREPAAQPAVIETAPTHTTQRRPATTTGKRDAEPAASEAPAVNPSFNPGPETPKPSGRTPLVAVDPDVPKSDMIQKRLDALRELSPKLSSKTGGNAEMTRNRIQYFIDQAAKALERKDLRQADSLASRAEVLAQDLLRVR